MLAALSLSQTMPTFSLSLACLLAFTQPRRSAGHPSRPRERTGPSVRCDAPVVERGSGLHRCNPDPLCLSILLACRAFGVARASSLSLSACLLLRGVGRRPPPVPLPLSCLLPATERARGRSPGPKAHRPTPWLAEVWSGEVQPFRRLSLPLSVYLSVSAQALAKACKTWRLLDFGRAPSLARVFCA